jgi:predicted DsbA family dithiol-disulfide isomerase
MMIKRRVAERVPFFCNRFLGLDTERFEWDVRTHVFAHRVDEDAESGRHSRVSGTPTFFINGTRHDDTYTIDVLLPAVRRASPLG